MDENKMKNLEAMKEFFERDMKQEFVKKYIIQNLQV